MRDYIQALARIAYGLGIATAAYVMIEPGDQLLISLVAGLLLGVGASSFAWENR